MDGARLDGWLPDPSIRTHHQRPADAGLDELWRSAQGVRLSDTRTLGRLVKWRIPGLDADLTFQRLFAEYPFTVLEEGEHHSVSGLCGRIWTFAPDYPELSGPEAFSDWSQPGTVKVVFAHWARALPEGRAELCSEARVAAVDRSAQLRLRTLWALVGVFERLIGAEPLTLAVRAAEEGTPAGTPR